MRVQVNEIRDYSKRGDALPIPNLIDVQIESYQKFLQKEVPVADRTDVGLEALLREVFPIESYDGNLRLEYISYDLSEPRYTTDECRALRLTFGMPFRIQVRFVRKDKDEVMEDSIYLGEIPIMIGGGEFIINGAERVIVNQLHRSPGVDFLVEVQEGDRPLHGCRVIPERGSWIECSVTKKDALAVRIDQSSKIPATTFIRALDKKYGTTEAIIREFYLVETVKVAQLTNTAYSAASIIDTESGEELVKAGAQIAESLAKIQASDLKTVDVVTKVLDPLILNTLADDTSTSHEDALMRIYARLRPGNPPQLEKAATLFHEKFYDENRYRLGRVGRFRINRKFDQDVPETEMTLRAEDLVNSLKYMFKLRSGEGYIDDIDHLGNRRLRTIDELAAEEMRKGFLKLKRTVQERMSLKDPNELGRIAELVNSKSISSSIDFFFGRGELSQVVDQTNPLAQLTHERRLSALGPGGLNRKRAGFEVRDVHISHYGRICPIETPEGTNIGLIASLAIYSDIDEYGFLITPYRVVGEDGKVNGQHKYLRADEEMKAILAPPDVVEKDKHTLKKGLVLARVQGDLASVPSKDVQYVDISPRQTVVGVGGPDPVPGARRRQPGVDGLEHAAAGRAAAADRPADHRHGAGAAGGAEQRHGRPGRAAGHGHVRGRHAHPDRQRRRVRAAEVRRAQRADVPEPEADRQEGREGQANQIIADGAAVLHGELALGRNVLVAFMTFDGYNFEDAIVINQKLVKEDTFTSIHIEEYDVEIRETKLGREEFTRDIPNVSERALANLDENGVVRVGTRVGPGDILVGKISPKSKSELTPEEKLLHAIFGRAGEDVKNDSLEMPAGRGGRRHPHPAVQPPDAHDGRPEEGPEEGHRDLREGDEPPGDRHLQADGRGDERGVRQRR